MGKPHLIGIEIAEESVGVALRKIPQLPGFVALHMKVDAPTVRSNGAAHRGQYSEPGHVAICSTLYGKPPMTTKQLQDAFVAAGRRPLSVNSAVHAAIKAGDVKRTPDGYTLTKIARQRLRRAKAKK